MRKLPSSALTPVSISPDDPFGFISTPVSSKKHSKKKVGHTTLSSSTLGNLTVVKKRKNKRRRL